MRDQKSAKVQRKVAPQWCPPLLHFRSKALPRNPPDWNAQPHEPTNARYCLWGQSHWGIVA
jgi:hypothetical protein